jgi:tRNA/rRNA methyltransferase
MNISSEQRALSKSGPAIILVRPQMPENIGSVARAMGNFGFNDLRIVNPTAEWPSDKATALACKSRGIIDDTECFSSLSKALIGCDFSYAMSARFRGRINKEIYTPKQATEHIKAEAQHMHKIAFIFGAENNGLINTELVLAQNIISIPTSDHHKALNIAQSACVLFYELFANIYSDYKAQKHRHERADMLDMDNMVDQLDKKLASSNFYKDEDRRQAMLLGITNIFAKASLSKSEIKTLNGIFKYLYLYNEP